MNATRVDEIIIPDLNDDLRFILGLPCFRCINYAAMLRRDGHTIEHKAEAEQAAVIHWLLQIYQANGVGWRAAADRYVKEHLERHEPKAVEGTNHG